MNKRQQRIVGALRHLGPYAVLRQHRGGHSAAWFAYSYPQEVRLKATCRDVHGLVMMGVVSSSEGWDYLSGRKLSPKTGFISHPFDLLDPS